MLEAKDSHSSKRTHFFHRHSSSSIEISMNILLKNCNLSIIRRTENHFLFIQLLHQNKNYICLVLIQLLDQNPVLQLTEEKISLTISKHWHFSTRKNIKSSDLSDGLVPKSGGNSASQQIPAHQMILGRTVQWKTRIVIFEAKNRRILNDVSINVNVVVSHRWHSSEKVSKRM